jgi:hypothetical protein
MAPRPSRPTTVSTYIVERYWPHAPDTGLAEAAMASRNAAAEMAAEGRSVRFVDAFVARQDEIVLTVFEADSAVSVREASERAGQPFDRISLIERLSGRVTTQPELEGG